MRGPIGLLHRIAILIERAVDRLSARLDPPDPAARIRMLAYAGYRNAAEIRVSGRIVRYSEPLDPGSGLWSRARAMLAIYNSHELAGVIVRFEGLGTGAETMSDEEGYFAFALPIATALPATTTWDGVTLSTPGRIAQADRIAVPVLAPGTDDRWAVLSDIDDTLIETGATDFLRNWRRVLIESPGERLAVPGAASLYGMIARDHRAPTRPFFYVSSSPWNLYGFLADFMERNAIPHGVMMLRDIGIDATKLIAVGHKAHKRAAIATILAFYPDHRFLLFGDNGQQDVAIYAEAVRAFPGRIAAVLIRDVRGDCAGGAHAGPLAEIAQAGVPTYCAAGFDEAVGLLAELGVERPAETATAGATAVP